MTSVNINNNTSQEERQHNQQQAPPPTPPPPNNEDKPIPGPEPVGPEYAFEPDWDRPLHTNLKFGRAVADLVRKPAHWIRENIIEPNRGPKYYWYHRKFERALPVDECYADDYVCLYEANQEFKRNRLVDKATLDLLRLRRDNCNYWHLTSLEKVYKPSEECQYIADIYDREELNFFIKYGDMQYNASVMTAYNKQKHRMIMDRRRALRDQQQSAEAKH